MSRGKFWRFELSKMPFLFGTAITILLLFAFDLQIRFLASTFEWFFVLQQFLEKLFLLTKFIKASLGKLEDFAKRDIVNDKIGGDELPLDVGLEFFWKGGQKDMLQGWLIESIKLIEEQGHALVMEIKILSIEGTIFHTEIVSSSSFKDCSWVS